MAKGHHADRKTGHDIGLSSDPGNGSGKGSGKGSGPASNHASGRGPDRSPTHDPGGDAQRIPPVNPPPVRVCLAGATGLIGQAVLARLAGDPRLGTVTALVRPAAIARPMPAGVARRATDFSALGRAGEPGLPPTDWAFCCLGTTLKVAGSQAAFRAVDFDAVLAFARAAKVAGASRLAVVSALGADARSSVFYNRVKGDMEQALQALGLPRLVIARPSLLLGERASLGQPSRPGEALAQALMPWFGWLTPRRLRPIHADAVAAAMVEALAAQEQPGSPAVQVLESDALQQAADAADAADAAATARAEAAAARS